MVWRPCEHLHCIANGSVGLYEVRVTKNLVHWTKRSYRAVVVIEVLCSSSIALQRPGVEFFRIYGHASQRCLPCETMRHPNVPTTHIVRFSRILDKVNKTSLYDGNKDRLEGAMDTCTNVRLCMDDARIPRAGTCLRVHASMSPSVRHGVRDYDATKKWLKTEMQGADPTVRQ